MTPGTIIDIKADTIGVVVPADIKKVECNYINVPLVHYCCEEVSSPDNWKSIPLPPGNWKVVCTSITMTEEEAKGLVEAPDTQSYFGVPLYKNYLHPENWSETVKTALESFRTLIEHKTGEYLHTNPFGEKEQFVSGGQAELAIHKAKQKRRREAQVKVIPNLLILNKH